MQIGGIVMITDGPLAGLAGRLASLSKERAIIVVQLNGRDIGVEIDQAWISRVPERKSVSSIEETQSRQHFNRHA